MLLMLNVLKYKSLLYYDIRSCYVLCLEQYLKFDSNDLKVAKEQNLSILSYLANELNSPVITIAPYHCFCGYYKVFPWSLYRAYEVMRDMIIKSSKTWERYRRKTVKTMILTFVVLTCWYVAYTNPSILGIIDALSGPLVRYLMYTTHVCNP